MDDIDENKQMTVPDKKSSTKQTWVTFYNAEAEAFEAFKPERKDGDERVFQTTKQPLNRKFRHVSEDTGAKITIQKLRRWFATETSRCGVDATHIDALAAERLQPSWKSTIWITHRNG